MPRVTVLTPTYRHQQFIQACISSVLDQTEQDWEMVVVDDGSDDGTPEIAESFRDPRITVLRRDHRGVGGLGGAYAAGLARGTSPLVAILEGDDTWPPSKLARQLPAFDDPTVVLSYGAAELIDSEGCPYARFWHAPDARVATNDPPGSILLALIRTNFIVAPTVMIRRSSLEDIGGFFQPEGVPFVDHPTWLRLALIGPFAHSSEILGRWRRYPGQVTTQAWFEDVPDRTGYLKDTLRRAEAVLNNEMLDETRAFVRQDRARQLDEAAVARGRIALLGGRWREAAQIFGRLFERPTVRTRAIALLGLSCAVARTDMEALISRLGRHSLPSRRHVASHPTAPTGHVAKTAELS